MNSKKSNQPFVQEIDTETGLGRIFPVNGITLYDLDTFPFVESCLIITPDGEFYLERNHTEKFELEFDRLSCVYGEEPKWYKKGYMRFVFIDGSDFEVAISKHLKNDYRFVAELFREAARIYRFMPFV